MPRMPSALITGITGQDGLYLAELLLEKGYDVHGLLRGQNNPRRALVEDLVPDVRLHTGDLTDLSSLMRAMRDSDPDEVYNLGAISFVAYSWENAFVTSDVTGMGVLNMLEAVRLHAGDDPSAIRFYQASSSEMFGKVQEVPQSETHPAVAPLALRRQQGLRPLHDDQLPRVLRHARLLGHPLQPRVATPRARSSSPARSARRSPGSTSGRQDSVALGNLDARRDWGYAGDYVEAMWRMLQQDEADDYVIATGQTWSIRDFLDVAFAHVGIDDWSKHVTQDPRFMRPAEVEMLIGDASKARDRLGWTPTVSFHELVAMMVDADIAAAKAGW